MEVNRHARDLAYKGGQARSFWTWRFLIGLVWVYQQSMGIGSGAFTGKWNRVYKYHALTISRSVPVTRGVITPESGETAEDRRT